MLSTILTLLVSITLADVPPAEVFEAANADDPMTMMSKLIPEFVICYSHVTLHSPAALLKIFTDFPNHVETRQEKCFLRCVLRRTKVFNDVRGKKWHWKNALLFLKNFGYKDVREPFMKSAAYYCFRKKKSMLSKYGCKNAHNFFLCLRDHGMSFRLSPVEDRKIREKYIKECPYLGENLTTTLPTTTTTTRKTIKTTATIPKPKMKKTQVTKIMTKSSHMNLKKMDTDVPPPEDYQQQTYMVGTLKLHKGKLLTTKRAWRGHLEDIRNRTARRPPVKTPFEGMIRTEMDDDSSITTLPYDENQLVPSEDKANSTLVPVKIRQNTPNSNPVPDAAPDNSSIQLTT